MSVRKKEPVFVWSEKIMLLCSGLCVAGLLIILVFFTGCSSEPSDNPVVDTRAWLFDPDPCTDGGTHYYATFIEAENEDQSFRDNFVFNGATWYISGGLTAFRGWWAEIHPDMPLEPYVGAMAVIYRDGSTELWIMGKKIGGKIWLDPRSLFEEIAHQFNFRDPDRFANPHDWYEKPQFGFGKSVWWP